MERIKLGKITAPVGIKGEVRVYPYTDEQTRFSAIKELFIEGKQSCIENVRYQKDMVILKLTGIETRNDAEAARGSELYLDKKDLWEVPEDTYFVSDILACKVFDEDDNYLGEITDVIQNSSQDLYKIENAGKSFLMPAVKEFILSVDTDNKLVKVHLIKGLTDL